jgi:DNA (cytosine-5)-methyltransferase 1
LYSGCGGLALGFRNVGFDIVAAFDSWRLAVETMKKNFSDTEVVEMDLNSFKGDVTPFSKFKPQVVIGGPPCQDFSSAGKRNENLENGKLTVTFAQIITAMEPKPDWFVMENVGRILKTNKYKIAKEAFKKAGYGITETVLDASLCGVPQLRKRFFMIGELNGRDNAIMPYLEKGFAKKRMTVRDYFGNSLGVEYYYRHPRTYERRAIFSIDEPSPTIRGVNRPIPSNYKKHPRDAFDKSEKVRPLTTLERSYIQTFPRDYLFIGSKTQQEQMIGNAVPVKLAEFVASSILKYIADGRQSRLDTQIERGGQEKSATSQMKLLPVVQDD